jgi:hypothetical protein
MGRRSKEEERERSRRRRSRGRSNRRTLKNIYVDDEETLRKALAAEGIHVTLCLEYAVMEKLWRICDEYKRAGAKKAWEELTDKPIAANGLLQRLESSEEPPQAPHKPRKHYTGLMSLGQFMDIWNRMTPEQRDRYWEDRSLPLPHDLQSHTPEPEPGEDEWDEMVERVEEEENDSPSPPNLQRTPPWSWSEAGERRHVGRTPSLSEIEGVQLPVPPKPSEEPQE